MIIYFLLCEFVKFIGLLGFWRYFGLRFANLLFIFNNMLWKFIFEVLCCLFLNLFRSFQADVVRLRCLILRHCFFCLRCWCFRIKRFPLLVFRRVICPIFIHLILWILFCKDTLASRYIYWFFFFDYGFNWCNSSLSRNRHISLLNDIVYILFLLIPIKLRSLSCRFWFTNLLFFCRRYLFWRV